MKITGKRRANRIGPLRLNRSGPRLTSVTLDLWLWRAVLWSAPPAVNRQDRRRSR